MKNKKVIIILVAALVVLAAAMGIVWKVTRPETEVGQKSITVTIVSSDAKEKDYQIKTDSEYLADALHEKKLVTDEEYKSGYYTVVDGVTADYNADKAWWCVTKDGEMTTVGMNEQTISDGDKFEITYTIG